MFARSLKFILFTSLLALFGLDAWADPKRIVVIGGGIGGLSSFDELSLDLQEEIKNGDASLELFTDTDRVGGRIWSEEKIITRRVKENGKWVEKKFKLVFNRGAELIDSTNSNLLGYAERYGIGLLERGNPNGYEEGTFYYRNRPVDGEQTAKKLMENPGPLAQIAQDQEKLDNFRLTKVERQKPPYTYGIEAELDKMSAAEYMKKMKATPFQRAYLESIVGETGVAADELSALVLFDLFKFDKKGKTPPEFLYANDEKYRIKGGTQQITDALYNQHKDSITKNHRLISIESADNKTYKLVFETPQGLKTVIADQVVLGIPFNEMQNVKINVKGISQEVFNAAKETKYGSHSKLNLYFDQRLWNTKYKHTGDAFGKGFQMWDSSMGQLTVNDPGSITFFLGTVGPQNANPEERAKLALETLEKRFPGISEHYLGHDIQSWSHSYTGSPLVGEKTKVSSAMSGIADNLYVAHEGVDTISYGYMEGAIRAGKRAAKQIAVHVKQAIGLKMPSRLVQALGECMVGYGNLARP